MKIKIIVDRILHGRDEFFEGEERVVDDVTGKYFCAAGWARDVDGKIETGELIVNKAKTLSIDNIRQATTAEVVKNG